MSERRRFLNPGDFLLFFWCVVLGLAAAGAFSAYRAVSASGEDVTGRLAEFGMNLVWPGVLIFGGVGAVVWFGWKANID